MDRLTSKIKGLVEANHDNVVSIRRHLHKHPELSFKEHETSKYVQEQLKSMGITDYRMTVDTGIVAAIGNLSKPPIYLRADMDALPITEANTVDYCSVNEGVMHACGHDVHTATLLGAMKVLKSMESELNHCIYCVFQPGEELLPGGASLMIKDGLFNAGGQAKMIGNHVHPPLKAGQVGFKSGIYMASADEIYLDVIGKGGHGAIPHQCIDPLPIVAEIITSLQTLVSRHANPSMPTVLTFGKINSDGGATNIIPSKISLQGTFRTFEEEWRSEAHKLIRQRVESICAAHGAEANLEIRVGYPSLYNDPKFTDSCYNGAIEYLGKDQVIDIPLRTTSEDFAYYSQEVPSCFYRIGTDSKDGKYQSSVHTPTFNVDEDCLLTSVGLMSFLALKG